MALQGEMLGKNAKKSIKKKGGGGQYLKNVPEDGITVRFLEEPDKWFGYKEGYDEKRDPKTFPLDDEFPELTSKRVSFRYLANVLDVDNKEVVPLKLSKTLANSLYSYFEKYKTILDRDYELEREGSGKETTYMAFPNDAKKRKVAEYKDKMHDLKAVLDAQVKRALDIDDDDDDDDDEDDKKSKSRSKRGSTGKTRTSKSGSDKGKSKKSKKAEEPESKPKKRTKAAPKETGKKKLKKSK